MTVESIDTGVRVLINGGPFAEYVTSTGHQPVVWPIVGPGGHERTRSWPLGPRKSCERADHPHHESLWFAHGGVNGHDFWHRPDTGGTQWPRIVHREFVRKEVADTGEAVIVTRNDWTADGTTVLHDERTFAFGLIAPISGVPRYIDATIRLTATDDDALLADTKEGAFGVRVPGTMKIDAGLGGHVRNSAGQVDADAWGQVANWVDYRGPLTEEADSSPNARGGVMIMSHPDADLPECRWHVRGYGLFAANPFGVKDFPGGGGDDRPTRVAAGETLTLRYRTIFYSDEVPTKGLQSWYDAFAATPLRRAR